MARELGNMRITYIVFRSKHNFYFVLLSLEDVYVFGWKKFCFVFGELLADMVKGGPNYFAHYVLKLYHYYICTRNGQVWHLHY